ncbi:Vps62-related protein [Solirubrobacter taibaiensis]|nr:Vps62-related protein [Solirubrobacter taibaiensis]
MLTQAASALALFAPVVVHDANETSPLTGVNSTAPAVYARAVPAKAGGEWLQYWLYYAYQDQDRGFVRTGRHEGDWELAQYRVVDDRLVEAVYAQHSGAERCGAAEVELRENRPVVYAAHGSHASYLHAGTRDRMWPDPNDEADGRGRVTIAPVVEITRTSPPWMTDPEPWGNSRASRLVPIEQDSPPGPYFQPTRWDAETFAANARPCQADCNTVGECDTPEKALSDGAIALLGLALWIAVRRFRSSKQPR